MKSTAYHHHALKDFDHCEKGRCINCSVKQWHICEDKLDREYNKRHKNEA